MNRLLTGDRHIDVLAVLVVLHVLALIGLRLVVITGAVGGDFHPRAVRHIELTNERRLKIRNLDAVEVAAGHGLAVHMPELSAQRHFHLHAVARDGHNAVVKRLIKDGRFVDFFDRLHVDDDYARCCGELAQADFSARTCVYKLFFAALRIFCF